MKQKNEDLRSKKNALKEVKKQVEWMENEMKSKKRCDNHFIDRKLAASKLGKNAWVELHSMEEERSNHVK